MVIFINKNYPNINIVGACDHNQVIGYKGKLPWDIPEEMNHFQKTTRNSTVICGRKTYESMNYLKNRETIVLTRTKNYDKIKTAESISETINKAEFEDINIIGGHNAFKFGMHYAEKIILSIIHDLYKGDRYFPSINRKRWKIKSIQDHEQFSVYQFIQNRIGFKEKELQSKHPIPNFV